MEAQPFNDFEEFMQFYCQPDCEDGGSADSVRANVGSALSTPEHFPATIKVEKEEEDDEGWESQVDYDDKIWDSSHDPHDCDIIGEGRAEGEEILPEGREKHTPETTVHPSYYKDVEESLQELTAEERESYRYRLKNLKACKRKNWTEEEKEEYERIKKLLLLPLKHVEKVVPIDVNQPFPSVMAIVRHERDPELKNLDATLHAEKKRGKKLKRKNDFSLLTKQHQTFCDQFKDYSLMMLQPHLHHQNERKRRLENNTEEKKVKKPKVTHPAIKSVSGVASLRPLECVTSNVGVYTDPHLLMGKKVRFKPLPKKVKPIVLKKQIVYSRPSFSKNVKKTTRFYNAS